MEGSSRFIKFCIIFAIIFAVAIIFIVLISYLGSIQNGKFEINSLTIQSDGIDANDSIDKYFTDPDFSLNVIINDNNYDKKNSPTITWEIVSEDNLNCKISNDGLFEIGDTIGNVIVEVTVTSKNTLTQRLRINIIIPDELTLYEFSATADKKLEFIEGQQFNPKGIKGEASFTNAHCDVFSVLVQDYCFDNAKVLAMTDSEIELTYTHKNIVKSYNLPIVVKAKMLQSIEIVSAPNQINYIEGQFFNSEGLKIRANFEFITIDDVKGYTILDADIALDPSKNKIRIYYTYDGITKTVEQSIIVKSRTLQNLVIESKPAKLDYVQGQYFNKDGLKVIANYEFMSKDVTNQLNFDMNDRLMSTDNVITFTYSENGIVRKGKLDINVREPYQDVCTIRFENPYDMSLSWLYEYVSDDGIVRIDDTDFDNHDKLLCDQENGIYVVPVGAVVTLLKISPAITGLEINSNVINIEYPSNSYSFEVEFGNENIQINFFKVIGERISVRFASEEIGQNYVFLYSNTYKGTLNEKDLCKVAQIFQDTKSSYYTYKLGTANYTFGQLANVVFDSNIVFIVTKNERILNNTVKINVVYPSTTIVSVVDKTTARSLEVLPKFNRIGYDVIFSIVENGEILTDSTFTTWIKQAQDNSNIYAKYILTATPPLTDVPESIIGVYVYENIEEQIQLTLTFNSDATYTYSLLKGGVENCSFSGIYKDNLDKTYSILSVEMNIEYSLISAADFTLSLDGNIMTSMAFVLDMTNLSVEQKCVQLIRQA